MCSPRVPVVPADLRHLCLGVSSFRLHLQGGGAAFGHRHLYFSESGGLLQEESQIPRPELAP